MSSRPHQDAETIARFHWGWLSIAIGAHAAAFYTLTQVDLTQRLGLGAVSASSAGVGPITVVLLGEADQQIEPPATTQTSADTPAMARPPIDTSESPVLKPGTTPGLPIVMGRSPTPPAPETRVPAPGQPGEPAAASPTAAESADGGTFAAATPLRETPGTATSVQATTHVIARFDAVHLRNSPPSYPQASRRRGEEGQVTLRVRVLANGQAGDIEIAESSGHPLLDRAARDAVARWRFDPARDGNRPVESWVRVPVIFRLERS